MPDGISRLPPDRAGKAGKTHGKNFEIRPGFLEMF
jgi:hypothetical protein